MAALDDCYQNHNLTSSEHQAAKQNSQADQSAASNDTFASGLNFGLGNLDFQSKLNEILGDDVNNQEAVKGVESMLKSLEKLMKEGNIGGELNDDLFKETIGQAVNQPQVPAPKSGPKPTFLQQMLQNQAGATPINLTKKPQQNESNVNAADPFSTKLF